MVSKELSEAAVEINVILENTSPEIVSKIPKKFIVFLKEIASKNYILLNRANEVIAKNLPHKP